MSKNVAFFLTGLDSGGLENYLLRFLKLHIENYDNVIVFCKSGKGGALEEEFRKLPRTTIVKKGIGNFNPIEMLKLFFWFKKHQNYSVCDFSGNFSATILFLANCAGVKKRITFYRSSSNRFKETSLRLAINNIYNRLVLKTATDILANSKYAIKFFFGDLVDKRIKVIYNGIDANEFLDNKDSVPSDIKFEKNKIVIGHTGRFNPAKNHEMIIKVAEKIIQKYPDVIFALFGKGIKDNLKLSIEKKGLEKQVFLFDNRSDISAVLNIIDIYYFPSITEGQPNSLIEAWIKGIPFVASNISPILDITPLEFQSSLVSPFDVEMNVNALSEILEKNWDEEKRLRLSQYSSAEFDASIRFNEFKNIL